MLGYLGRDGLRLVLFRPRTQETPMARKHKGRKGRK